jgi:hypothetical protein
MKTVLGTAAVALVALTAATHAASFHAAKPQPLDDVTYLECVPTSASAYDRDPVYKIAVTLNQEDVGDTGILDIVHHARSGTTYNRADQYGSASVRRTPGKTEWYWTGTWKQNRAVEMQGRLWRTTDMKWFYTEQQYRYGALRYSMASDCHVTGLD